MMFLKKTLPLQNNQNRKPSKTSLTKKKKKHLKKTISPSSQNKNVLKTSLKKKKKKRIVFKRS